jgi:hypothetical protein
MEGVLDVLYRLRREDKVKGLPGERQAPVAVDPDKLDVGVTIILGGIIESRFFKITGDDFSSPKMGQEARAVSGPAAEVEDFLPISMAQGDPVRRHVSEMHGRAIRLDERDIAFPLAGYAMGVFNIREGACEHRIPAWGAVLAVPSIFPSRHREEHRSPFAEVSRKGWHNAALDGASGKPADNFRATRMHLR